MTLHACEVEPLAHVTTPARVVSYLRLFHRLPIQISTSDPHHWILRKKFLQIRAYDFGVRFSFQLLKDTSKYAQAFRHRKKPNLIMPYNSSHMSYMPPPRTFFFQSRSLKMSSLLQTSGRRTQCSNLVSVLKDIRALSRLCTLTHTGHRDLVWVPWCDSRNP